MVTITKGWSTELETSKDADGELYTKVTHVKKVFLVFHAS